MTKGVRTLDLDPVDLTLETNSIKIDTPVQGRAINNEVYFTYTVTPQTSEGFDPSTAVLTVMESETGKKILEIPNIPSTTGQHTIQFKAKDSGWVFDVAQRYTVKIAFDEKIKSGLEPTTKIARIPLEWQALATDYNRDGRIDASDLDYAAKGNIDRTADPSTGIIPEAGNKYYFWINDNADVDDVEGNSIPGSGSDFKKTQVSGTRDLVDYFPLLLDIGGLVKKLPSDKFTYVLRHRNSAVNFVATELVRGETKSYLTDVATAKTFERAEKRWIRDYGVTLDKAFLQAMPAGGERVILVDGRTATRSPLVLEVWEKDKKDVAFRSELPLSIDAVEQMFRHVNLIGSIDATKAPAQETSGIVGRNKAEGGEKNRISENDVTAKDHFKGYDTLCSDKYAVIIHGANVNGQDARAWHAEMFKRLYWAGSKAKLVGISWFSFDGPKWNYYQNVMNAFKTAKILGPELKQVTNSSPVTILSHSLGNMLTTGYLVDQYQKQSVANRPNITGYMMLNAAVALEAFLGDYEAYGEGKLNEQFDSSNKMVHSDWFGYQKRFGASEWHQLFDAGDDRSKLTWRNRFAGLPGGITYVNFFSKGEDVLADFEGTFPTMWDTITFNLGRNAWVLQEKWKGRPAGIAGSDYMGWGFNLEYNPHLSASDANSLLTDNGQLKTKPFFAKSAPNNGQLFTNSDIAYDVINELLAYALPALTTPAGGWHGDQISRNSDIAVLDMNSRKSSNWPRDKATWQHSDIKDVSIPYIYQVVDELVIKGALR